MRRKRIIIIGTLVALAGVAAPLGLTWQWSQQRAIAAEQQRLRFLASHALQRAERTFRDAAPHAPAIQQMHARIDAVACQVLQQFRARLLAMLGRVHLTIKL